MTTSTPGDVPIRRIDRILAFMSLGLLVLSVVCFLAVIIASSAGADMRSGLWPTAGLLMLVAPPVAFACLVAVLTMSFVRRARANKGR